MTANNKEIQIPDDEEILQIIDAAFRKFDGSVDELESAIGALHIIRRIGWKPLMLMHTRKTFKKYEDTLGINFRERFPEEGEFAKKSQAWKALQKIGGFWQAVKGEKAGIRSTKLEK